MRFGLSLIIAAIVAPSLGARHGTSDASIDLQDVATLTFKAGQMTKGRRAAPVPQLACVSGKACSTHSHLVDVVQCRNVGVDDLGSVQWECHSDLEDTVRFGSINVNCEGYSHSQDARKLRGSCGLEYTLQYTDNGRRQQDSSRHGRYDRDSDSYYSSHSSHHHRSRSADSDGWGGTMLFLGLLAVLIVVVMRERAAASAPAGFTSRPPPYNPNSGAPPPYNQSHAYPSQQHPNQGGGAGNFWGGFTAGGILGGLATMFRPRPYAYGPGGWGGGGAGWNG
eukprot:CAMPEP_0196724312 /NCGR_PEP_ID=MMETSP1091-20130531/6216_1 /TAXON_ID=302021 /ORGANISM="Rhodomonas sp., Strain CCMP768" /LENGTH=279 /DNA_ID=CAMNT_0042066415 /DNA_START=13 /DNA_END=849 /DNA_ORIENTATION=-